MNRHLKLEVAAALVAATIAIPAWSQALVSGSATSKPAAGTAAPATTAAPGTSVELNDPQLRARCFDEPTRTWKATSECSALIGSAGTRSPGPSNGNAPGTPGLSGAPGAVNSQDAVAPRGK